MDWLMNCLAGIWYTFIEGPWYSRLAFLIVVFLLVIVLRWIVKKWNRHAYMKNLKKGLIHQ